MKYAACSNAPKLVHSLCSATVLATPAHNLKVPKVKFVAHEVNIWPEAEKYSLMEL